MRFKLIYSAPVSVVDSLDEPVKDLRVYSALAGLSHLDGTVLEHLSTELTGQADFRGGFVRLTQNGKRLEVRIEIDSPGKLEESELLELRQSLDGQVSDGIGEGAFDILATTSQLFVTTFPELGSAKSSLRQSSGVAWLPESIPAESAANLRRCEDAAAAFSVVVQEEKEKPAKRKKATLDPKKLFKLVQKACERPRPNGIDQEIAAEIATLGGDLSFIKSGKFPYERLGDPALLQLLLDSKLDPNLRDRDGHSLLWLACGNSKCIALLLERGVDPNIRNTEVYQHTALMEVARLGLTESVRLLLERGADPQQKDHFGRTALDLANANQHHEGSPDTLRILTESMREESV